MGVVGFLAEEAPRGEADGDTEAQRGSSHHPPGAEWTADPVPLPTSPGQSAFEDRWGSGDWRLPGGGEVAGELPLAPSSTHAESSWNWGVGEGPQHCRGR